MAGTRKELQERKNSLSTQIQEMNKRFNDGGQKWKDAEERETWKKVNADYDAVRTELEAAIEADNVASRAREIAEQESRSVNDRIPGREDTRNQRPLGDGEGDGAHTFTDADYREALNGWARGSGLATEAHRRAMERVGLRFSDEKPFLFAEDYALAIEARARLTSRQSEYRYRPAQGQQGFEQRMRALEGRMSSLTGSTGGYLVRPGTLQNRLEVNMLAFGGMRQVAETIVTETGEPLEWPTFDDTANSGSQVNEGDVGSASDPSVGKITWNAYNITSGVLKAPFILLRDSMFDIVALVESSLGERLGRKSNTLYTTGNGAAKAKGIIPASTSGVTTASATAIAFGEIMALIHSIDPAYRAMGCQFMSHDNILLAIRQLVDSQNRPLYVSGLVEGMPDRILGFPHVPNQDMDSAVTATKKTLLFGRLSQYKIRRAGGPRLYRLEERYRDEDKTGFVAFISEDGNLLNAGTQPTKYITQHS